MGMIAWERDPTGSGLKWANVLMVAGTVARWAELPPSCMAVITRSGRDSTPGMNTMAEPFVPQQESRRGEPGEDVRPLAEQEEEVSEPPEPTPTKGWGGRGRPQIDTQPAWRQGKFVDDPIPELEEGSNEENLELEPTHVENPETA